MKRIAIFLLCLFLVCPLLTAQAANPKILDDAGLLWYGEAELLESMAQDLADKYGMDVVILTVNSTNGTYIETFADDFYDYNGYGIGEDASGILLVLAMDTREWAISTCGDAIYAFTDFGIQALFEDIAPYLSEDEYYEAFEVYLEVLPYYFEAYEQGSPIDGWTGNYQGPGSVEIGTREEVVYYESEPNYLLAPVIGMIMAGVIILFLRTGMNTKRPQHSAVSYVIPDTDRLRQRDIYLYSQVRKVRKQQSSSGGHGGGSSVHRGSSGRSHGGGHGRF